MYNFCLDASTVRRVRRHFSTSDGKGIPPLSHLISVSLFPFQAKPKSLQNTQPLSKLSSQNLYNISIEIAEEIECCVTVLPVIKNENHRLPSPVPSIKEEYDNTFPETNSDDEKLIEISKKITKVKKKKRKRKEVVIFKEIELAAEELEEERRLAMLKEDYVNAMFRCERCIISFPNAEDLSDHISKKHKLVSRPIIPTEYTYKIIYHTLPTNTIPTE